MDNKEIDEIVDDFLNDNKLTDKEIDEILNDENFMMSSKELIEYYHNKTHVSKRKIKKELKRHYGFPLKNKF